MTRSRGSIVEPVFASSTERVCVVTGASSGIGREIAIAFARRGAHVVLVARRKEALERTLAVCGGRGRCIPCDVSDPVSLETLAADIANTEGACHVLVNNAGVGARGSSIDDADWPQVLKRVMSTNFTSAALLTHHLLPVLERSRPSSVVNVGSIAGLVPTASPIYSASKFALVGFTESLAQQLRRRGVRVAAVHPGPVPTPGFPHLRLQQKLHGRLLIATAEQVAEQVVATAGRRGHPAAVVPRLYRLLPLLRAVAPRLYHSAAAALSR